MGTGEAHAHVDEDIAHLLMDGPIRWRELREALVEDLQHMGRAEALAKHFGPDVLRAVEADARAHLTKLAKEH